MSSTGQHPASARVLDSDAPKQGTYEWLKWRRSRLTASDAANINGVMGRKRLLREKSGRSAPSFHGNEYTNAGHEHEPHAVSRYAELRPETRVYTDLKPVCHPEHQQLAASLDAITEDGVNVEIKTLSAITPYKKPKAAHVQQVQYQMACTGLEVTDLVYYYLNVVDDEGRCTMHVHKIAFDESWWEKRLPDYLKFVEEINVALEGMQFDMEQVFTEMWLEEQ